LVKKEEGRSSALPFINHVDELTQFLSLSKRSAAEIRQINGTFPFRIPKFYLSLFDRDNPSCPLRRQSVPSVEELTEAGEADPLSERSISVTPSLLKRYPGRAVFLASAECAMYCRFCNRRRLVGGGWHPRSSWEESFGYIERDGDLREIIISGGDPFMLPVADFIYMADRLKGISRIKTIRISTRLPIVYPEGLREEHLKSISEISPVWLVLHINHPRELSPEFQETVKRLRTAGAVIVSQTVLLKGVNDCPHILLKLFEALVSIGIKPYYLFQLDGVRGAAHFKVKLEEGVRIMRFLRSNGSGLAVPQYALDIPGGFGKVPVDGRYLKGRKGRMVSLESPAGSLGSYRDDGKKSSCQRCGLCEGKIF
jgi:lysine 2,3-aminomutase